MFKELVEIIGEMNGVNYTISANGLVLVHGSGDIDSIRQYDGNLVITMPNDTELTIYESDNIENIEEGYLIHKGGVDWLISGF